MVPKKVPKMAKISGKKSAEKYCGEAGSPGSPGQGRGEFFLAWGIMFPGFPALGPGGDIAGNEGAPIP